MKYSGNPWIGNIPSSWDVERIKTIFKERTELSEDGSETLLSVSEYYGVANRSERVSEGEFVSRAETLVGYKKCYVGDLVSNIMLAWKGSMGITDIDGIVSPAYCVYEPSPRIFPRYYHYLFRTSLYTSIFRLYSKGIIDSRLRLYSPYFFDISAIIPSLPEQQKIASFLDRKCAEIDEMIALQEKIVEELKAYKQSVITEAVTKGLNPDTPMKDSGIEWIGDVPEHWNVKPIKWDFDIIAGATPKTDKPELWDGDIPWITPADYKTEDRYINQGRRCITEEGMSSCATTLLPKGSVIFSKRAPIGLVVVNSQPLCTNQGCLGCVPRNANSSYFYYAMSAFTEQYELYGSGTTFKEISATNFADFRLPCPSIVEQEGIALYLDRKCSEIDSLINIKLSKIDSLKEYKKSIIYEYVTGKKEVTE